MIFLPTVDSRLFCHLVIQFLGLYPVLQWRVLWRNPVTFLLNIWIEFISRAYLFRIIKKKLGSLKNSVPNYECSFLKYTALKIFHINSLPFYDWTQNTSVTRDRYLLICQQQLFLSNVRGLSPKFSCLLLMQKKMVVFIKVRKTESDVWCLSLYNYSWVYVPVTSIRCSPF